MKLDLFEKLYETEQCDDVVLYKINFGKYKGKTYKWIYDNDKSYVIFLIKKLDYNNNKIMIDYFKEQIENEPDVIINEQPKQEEKKQRKPRTKKTDEVKELFVIKDESD